MATKKPSSPKMPAKMMGGGKMGMATPYGAKKRGGKVGSK